MIRRPSTSYAVQTFNSGNRLGTSSSITWRCDYQGAAVGFTLTVKDGGALIYWASIDIQRDYVGCIVSYGGTVRGADFPDFVETAENQYNAYGGLAGADVTKRYAASEVEYEMEITRYCPMASGDLTGYKVRVGGQVITIGSCP